MHEAFADRICGGMPRAVKEQPFGPGMIVWTIEGHMFAAYTEAGEGLSVRAAKDDDPGVIALTQFSNAKLPATEGEPDWVIIPWETRPEVLRQRIAASYDLVLSDKNIP